MSRPAPPPPVSSHPGRRAGVGLPLHAILFTLGVTIASGLATEVGLLLTRSGPGPSLFWPTAGVALAAIVRFGWRAIPGLVRCDRFTVCES